MPVIRRAFTLVELLVVIAIIALLAAILFPVFAQAKVAGKKTANISNVRQLSLGIHLYVTDAEGFPMMSSLSTASPRTRWPDYVYPYVKNERIFQGPLAPPAMFAQAFAHNASVRHGGYGYNYQYLGNSRVVAGDSRFPFTATDTQIETPTETIVISDTQGVRNDAGRISGHYTIDPPLTSARGSGRDTGFYGGAMDCGSGVPNTVGQHGCRSTPAEWHTGRVSIAFADGHAKSMPRARMDDKNGDGVRDNGWWNGSADPTLN
ncbi:MAG TPA: hypothetical protein DCY02_06245 [Armatimonadetes bacterium]|nr:hypothetical protein [Armatimonadota bacterium]